MNTLIKIASSASPDTGVQFREGAYGRSGLRDFLRDVLALANAAVDGKRYLVTGISFDENNQRRVSGVDNEDFMGKPSYQSLVADYIEPPVHIKYQPVTLQRKTVGVFEISDCRDKPYMMRIDYSETLRRGDAYVRVNDNSITMGRRQLQLLFEKKFQESVPTNLIEVGFPGEIVHKNLDIATTDLSSLPSAIAAAKLRQMADVYSSPSNHGSTTVLARLTHARLFGADSPYEAKSSTELQQEINDIEHKHRDSDERFLYGENGNDIQLVIYNQGDQPIEDASLSLVLPNHNAFFVAQKLPGSLRAAAGTSTEADYPVVNLKDDLIQVSARLGELPPNEPTFAFEIPLRICVGAQLRGRRLGIHYSVFGSNLSKPAKGKLRLVF